MAFKLANKAQAKPQILHWTDGHIRKGEKSITSLNYTLHYGTPCVWEGIRAYKQKDGSTKIFKVEEHMKRLVDSAKICGFTLPHTADQLVSAAKTLVEACGGGDLYIRPIAYSANGAEAAKPQKSDISVDIYAFPLSPLHRKGVKCIISSHQRSYPYYQMQAKTSENYSFLQKVKPEIHAAKADDALLMDKDGYIVEATVANIFVFKDSVAMTPPNDGSILPGITRRCIAHLLQDPSIVMHYKRPITLIEKRITRADIYTADCIILCGTYAEVVPVDEVDSREFDSRDNFFYKMLKKEYTKLVRGNG